MDKHLPNKSSTQENATQQPASFKEEKQTTESSNDDNHTYGQILKSSLLIGGSTVITILIGIIRTKFMAILLGPSGVGLMGIFNSIIDLTQSVVGMGINSSGVRQIAKSVGSNDETKIAKTVYVLKRTSIFLGFLGALFIFGFSSRLSLLTFANEQQTGGIALLSLAVFFNLLSAGQGALIQAMRRITDLAKIGILGAIYGTLISIPTVYFLGNDGIAPALVLISFMSLLTSWWYRRKIKLDNYSITKSELTEEQIALLKLGFAFMASGLMMAGTSYLVRMIIVREAGFDASGLYQAAWTLGGLYVGIILQAMGTDFYPRLTAIADNNPECNRIVNEQTHISLLMACPGIIATLTLAPIIIEIFYSTKFQGAVELLRWLCLGMALRVISWPMGFIIMAKGAQNQLIISELAWASIYLILTLLCIKYFNLTGVGIAFFGSYVFHIMINFVIVRKLSNFNIHSVNLKLAFHFLAVLSVVFYNYYAFNIVSAIAIGLLATLFVSIYAILEVLTLISLEKIPRQAIKLLQLLHFIDSHTLGVTAKQSREGKSSVVLTSTHLRLVKMRQVLIMFVLGNLLLIIANQFIGKHPFSIDFSFLDNVIKNIPGLNFDFRH